MSIQIILIALLVSVLGGFSAGFILFLSEKVQNDKEGYHKPSGDMFNGIEIW